MPASTGLGVASEIGTCAQMPAALCPNHWLVLAGAVKGTVSVPFTWSLWKQKKISSTSAWTFQTAFDNKHLRIKTFFWAAAAAVHKHLPPCDKSVGWFPRPEQRIGELHQLVVSSSQSSTFVRELLRVDYTEFLKALKVSAKNFTEKDFQKQFRIYLVLHHHQMVYLLLQNWCYVAIASLPFWSWL